MNNRYEPSHGPEDAFDPSEKGSFRRRAKRHYLWALQLLAVGLSYLGRSRIVRFITAKLGLSFVVEVTDRFGAPAGHRISTFISALIAEPRLIALVLAGIFLAIDLIIILVRSAGRRRHHHHTHHRPRY